MKYIWLFLLIINSSLFGQKNIQLSSKSEISILTCAPGVKDLHAFFGHSAIRVKDPINGLDQIYNYGTFDFKTPNFYLKFCRGQLLYQVISYPYKYFPYEYYKQNRWVKSQVLNLSEAQNQKIYNFLEWNILPENKKYRYDFFYDNCSTKMYEIIEQNINPITFDYQKFPKELSHRNLIHRYLQKNSWAKFGIDLALGSVIDSTASFKEYMFLPDYAWLGFSNSKVNDIELVKKEKYILEDKHLTQGKINFLTSPIFISLIFLVLSIFSILKHNNFTKAWDSVLTFTLGIAGILIIFLWFFTEHSTTKNNFNIFWANPLLIALLFTKLKTSIKLSYLLLFSFTSFLFIGLLGIQQFDISFYIISCSMAIILVKKLLPLKV